MAVVLTLIALAAIPGWHIAAQSPDALALEVRRLAPPILKRAQWQAAPALEGMTPQVPRSIVVHHTGVAQTAARPLADKLRRLQAFSQREAELQPGTTKPAWGDIPYHYYIDMTGRIAEGRDPRFAGDSNTPYDLADKLQVVIEGDFEVEQPKPAQLNALRELLAWLQLAWNIGGDKISVHRDHATGTNCPGRNLLKALPGVLSAAAQRRIATIKSTCAARPGPLFKKAYCARR